MSVIKNCAKFVLASGLLSALFVTSLVTFTPKGQVLAQVDEIIVQATRRDTDLQTTPVAVSAVQGEAAETIFARDIGDIAVLVPNFSAATITAFNAASFAMRGAGQADIIVYSDPPVGVAIDGFVVPHVQTQLLDAFDIEQIEVLRGPQGTLFGKNTTAGMVTLRTKRPVIGELTTKASLLLANYGRREIRAAVNIPASDKLAFRFAGLFVNSDGYYKNGGPVMNAAPLAPFTQENGMTIMQLATTLPWDGTRGDGRDLGGEDVFSGRFKALYEPNDNLSVVLQYEVIRDESDSVPAVNESPAGSSYAWAGPLFGVPELSGDPLDNAAVTNRDDNLLNMSQGQRVYVDGFYINADWRLNKGTLHYVGGYREQESRLPNTYTGVGGTLSLFDANRSDDRETAQHELRFTSDFGGNLEFVTGLFYQEDETTFCVTQIIGFLDYFAAVNFAPRFGGSYNENPLVLCNAQEQEARAAFIDGSYDISDRFTISAGLRYTEEEKSWIGRNRVAYQQLTGGFVPTLTAESLGHPLAAADFVKYSTGVRFTDREWSEESYRLTLSYQATDDVFYYATYAHGFKSGAFNDQTGTVAALTDRNIAPTDPEFADSMELGVKSDLFDNQFRLNAALFRVEYEDAQRQLNATFGVDQETRFFNAAEVTVDGLEVEFTWAPINIPGLNVAGNFSWQDGEFDKFEADTNFDGTVDVDLSGRDLIRAPDTQWTLQLAYERPIMNNLDSRFVVTATYEDENLFTHADLGEDFDTYLNDKTLVDVSYGIHNREKGYSITAFVQNATDERYRTASQAVATLWVHTQYGPPRTYGVQLAVEF